MAARRRSETLLVTTIRSGERSRHPDELIVEEPMTVQLDGITVSTTMRTPGNDYELAVGFCFGEGLLGGATVTGVRYCANGSASSSEFNVVTVDTGGRAPAPRPRLGNTTSSCGLCGNDAIDELCARLTPLAPTPPIPTEVLMGVPDAVSAAQTLFAATGAVHAAAAFTADGTVLLTREDVGRHNAVDKVIGWAFLEEHLPLSESILMISGRGSFEIVQKAVAAGIPIVCAVSAPSSLAVDLARRFDQTLIGFLRGPRFNIYSSAKRIELI